jgi:hypothetical protein
MVRRQLLKMITNIPLLSFSTAKGKDEFIVNREVLGITYGYVDWEKESRKRFKISLVFEDKETDLTNAELETLAQSFHQLSAAASAVIAARNQVKT